MLRILPAFAPKVVLAVGEPLPAPLMALMEEGAGTILHRDTQYEFSTQIAGEDSLFLLSKTAKKLESTAVAQFLQRIRQGMSLADVGLDGILTAVGAERIDKVGALHKSHYSMVRALEHMELLSGQRIGTPAVQMELVGYCQQLSMGIAPLMETLNVTVEVVPKSYGLLVLGEEWLLQRLILGLISNAIQSGGGRISLQLSKSGKRCKIVISDNCPSDETPISPEKQLHRSLLAEPDSLDMTTARLLAKGLNGSILVGKTTSGGNKITIALPLSEEYNLPVKSPNLSEGDRYNMLLVEFADVLPSKVFLQQDVE